jgi:hypothetical protein
MCTVLMPIKLELKKNKTYQLNALLFTIQLIRLSIHTI